MRKRSLSVKKGFIEYECATRARTVCCGTLDLREFWIFENILKIIAIRKVYGFWTLYDWSSCEPIQHWHCCTPIEDDVFLHFPSTMTVLILCRQISNDQWELRVFRNQPTKFISSLHPDGGRRFPLTMSSWWRYQRCSLLFRCAPREWNFFPPSLACSGT